MKLSIGQVSKIFDISKDTLRYYDKIGILTPEVDKNNGYRYYLLKHLEKLGLILGIKYLGISLADIKKTIESEDVKEYKNLVIREEEIIKRKIKELEGLQEIIHNSKEILDKIINFDNEYDFSKLKITDENFNIYGFDTKIVLNSDLYKKDEVTIEKELVHLNEEAYIYIYNILENESILEDETMAFIKENENNISLIQRYLKEDKIGLVRKNVSGKFVTTSFYGAINEINDYIILLNKYFKCEKNNIAYVSYEFYLPKRNNDEVYFVNIKLKV